MSDYEDDEEPLHMKPLLAEEKYKLVPGWANDDNELEKSAKRQMDQDASGIFGYVPTTGLRCNLRDIFGRVLLSTPLKLNRYSPNPEGRKNRRAPPPCSSPDRSEAHSATSEEESLGEIEDIEMRCVAHDTINKNQSGEPIMPGNVYLALMRNVDTFGNLRRHYAKYNHVSEGQIVLELRREGQPVSIVFDLITFV